MMSAHPAHPARGLEGRERPVVSVIIPTYNRAPSIGAAIDSALSQTYRALEIVVVDDGSTDDTQRVLGLFAPSIVNIHQENRGVAAARNAGINRSRGSIIMFLDSDDLWFPQTVETQVDVLEAAGTDVPCVMCNLTASRGDGSDVTMFADRKLHPEYSEGLWTNVQEILTTRFLFTNQTLAIRREALEIIGLFDESLWVMEDFDLAMRLSTLGPWAYTTQVLAIRREGFPNSLSALARSDPKRFNATVLAICRKMQAEDVPTTRLAHSAIAYMARRAIRGLRLTEAAPLSTRAFLRAQVFVEEEMLERMYRNSWLFPRLESVAL
jgi:glycosyltransferase involved in cell wall biosynthesis